MKKIILIACDPGGANTIAPLINPLENLGFSISLFGKNTAIKRYNVIGQKGQDLSLFLEKFEFEDILNFVRLQKPDFIVTGTSAEDFTEKYIWMSCRELNIPCFAILDQWVNYGVRFSKYKASEIEIYNKNKDHSFMPSKICVMDNFAKQKMIGEGIDADKIVVTGHPYFDWISNEFTKKNNNLCCIKNKILFVSEPIYKTFGGYLGYTEKSIFIELVDALEIICSKNSIQIEYAIKLHPREDLQNFANLINSLKSNFVKFEVIQEFNFLKILNNFEIICGMSSMALLEAVILKKNVISIQIGLNKESPFILDNLGILKSIKNKEDLIAKLESVLVDKKRIQCDFNFVQNAIKNVIAEIEGVYNACGQNTKSKCINQNQSNTCN